MELVFLGNMKIQLILGSVSTAYFRVKSVLVLWIVRVVIMTRCSLERTIDAIGAHQTNSTTKKLPVVRLVIPPSVTQSVSRLEIPVYHVRTLVTSWTLNHLNVEPIVGEF